MRRLFNKVAPVEMGQQLPDMSRRRFLIGSATIAAAMAVDAVLPESAMATEGFETLSPALTEKDVLVGEHHIHRLYQAAFGRAPDPAGFDFHMHSFRDKHMSSVAIADSFTASEEWQTAYDGLNQAQVVEKLYRNILDREPDTVGRDFWVSELEQGVSLETVLVYISNSAENVAKTGTLPANGLFYHPGEVEYANGIGGPVVPVTGDMLSISGCESNDDPTVKNPTSSASGLYQYLNSTWNELLPKVIQMYPWLASLYVEEARHAAVNLQHLVTYHTLKKDLDNMGIRHWNPSNSCHGLGYLSADSALDVQ